MRRAGLEEYGVGRDAAVRTGRITAACRWLNDCSKRAARGSFYFVGWTALLVAFSARGAEYWTLASEYVPGMAGQVEAFARHRDGKVVVYGSLVRTGGSLASGTYGVVRLNEDGTRDPSFAVAAIEPGEWIEDLAAQPDGGTVAIGNFFWGASSRSAIRFRADGSRDPDFKLTDSLFSGQVWIVAGLVTDEAGYCYAVPRDTQGNAKALTRYTPSGEVDPSFAGPSDILSGFGIACLIPALDGSLFVSSWNGRLRKLRHDGSVDPSFTLDPSAGWREVCGLFALPDHRVLVISRDRADTLTGSDGEILSFLRLDQTGTIDYRYYSAYYGVWPARFDPRNNQIVAGVLFDLLRESGVVNASVSGRTVARNTRGQFHVDWSGQALAASFATYSFGDWSFAKWQRTALNSPSVDPAITFRLATSSSLALRTPGTALHLSVAPGGLYPVSYQWFKNGLALPAETGPTLEFKNLSSADVGAYRIRVSNRYHSATRSYPLLLAGNGLPPVIVQEPRGSQIPPGSGHDLSASVYGTPAPSLRWLFNGRPSPMATIVGRAGAAGIPTVLRFVNFQPADAGLYSLTADNNGSDVRASEPTIMGLRGAAKITGHASEVGSDIRHPDGNIYDQVLLHGAAAVQADPGQILRASYIDLNNDIVQVEFSGAGTLNIGFPGGVTGPAPASNYHQDGVAYVKGHANLIVVDADETTHLSVFSVGRLTALNPTLFRDEVDYDGVADLGYIAISSPSGRFGGLRAGNAHFFASVGFAGLFSPGIEFTKPIFIGEIEAYDSAVPLLAYRSAAQVTITGGDLRQPNGRGIWVRADPELQFTAGTTSHGEMLPAQSGGGTFERHAFADGDGAAPSS